MWKQQYYKTRVYRRIYIFVFLMCIKIDFLSVVPVSVELEKTKEQRVVFAFLRDSCHPVLSEHFYVHDLYCQKRSPLYRFFFAQYTTSTLYYYAWTVFEHFLKKFIGVYKTYKKTKNFEFYYGSVVGVGWYPQSLKIGKNFRIGFFDVFVNFIYVFMHCCHFLCHAYFKCWKRTCSDYRVDRHFYRGAFSDDDKKNDAVRIYGILISKTWENLSVGTFTSGLSYYTNGLVKKLLFSLDILISDVIDFSLLNIETCSGIKIKMLTFRQILKFFKTRVCESISNVYMLALDKYNSNVNPSMLYSYGFDSHFFFGEKDSIFLLLLELFIPNIEINIGELFKK